MRRIYGQKQGIFKLEKNTYFPYSKILFFISKLYSINFKFYKKAIIYLKNITQYFTITIDIKNDINDEDYLKEGWLKLLENIYGTKTNNYDGYVNKIFVEEKSSFIKLYIDCYIISNEKLYKLKENNPDNWEDIQNTLIINAIKKYDKFEKLQLINIQVDKKLF